MTDATDLTAIFQPMISSATGMPFAYRALVEGAGRRSFAAVAASLQPEQRPALEVRRIELAIGGAVDAGLLDSDALLAIPVGAATGKSEALLGHLFRVALQHRFPTDRIIVEINADERGGLDCAALLAQACAARGIAISLDGFAAGRSVSSCSRASRRASSSSTRPWCAICMPATPAAG
ncbi:MAG: EAL domain-containing protein [Sphingomonadales bacterium]|nr:MAG: EAL domain-containing protein [Sphingomonadales bacterium]